MEIGFVGLGKMGMNMVTRLQRDAHRVQPGSGLCEPAALHRHSQHRVGLTDPALQDPPRVLQRLLEGVRRSAAASDGAPRREPRVY